ncbi:MAG: histidine phosphatase family protein [Chloroflexi bacterium]|nr:MAG: histidine phosphatase family protein [Chloroflexota bacterium]
MTHLYLIRHGQAINVVQKTSGDPGLSPLGVKQAERLRDRLAASGEIATDVLITSTMLRAKQTAEIIAPALGLPIIFDDEVQEQRPGEALNMSEEEFREKFGPVEFEQKPYFRLAPGAESWVEFSLRASTALQRITREHDGKTIVIISHGGIIDASFLFFLGLSSLQFPQVLFDTHNTSITHWYKEANDWVEQLNLPVSWILDYYNDTMHLRDLDSPVRIPWKQIAAKPVTGIETSMAPSEAGLLRDGE